MNVEVYVLKSCILCFEKRSVKYVSFMKKVVSFKSVLEFCSTVSTIPGRPEEMSERGVGLCSRKGVAALSDGTLPTAGSSPTEMGVEKRFSHIICRRKHANYDKMMRLSTATFFISKKGNKKQMIITC